MIIIIKGPKQLNFIPGEGLSLGASSKVVFSVTGKSKDMNLSFSSRCALTATKRGDASKRTKIVKEHIFMVIDIPIIFSTNITIIRYVTMIKEMVERPFKCFLSLAMTVSYVLTKGIVVKMRSDGTTAKRRR